MSSSRDPQRRGTGAQTPLRSLRCALSLTGILSVVVLKRKLRLFHWLGMLLVCAGALIVGSRCSLSLSLSLARALSLSIIYVLGSRVRVYICIGSIIYVLPCCACAQGLAFSL